ncbi:DUF1648 domain-containing protein [Paucisalibacillus sp. EB02]|uniref:DUF1648 domain-containing protein n=1 Tax=Paucisalibacillus sp. EB02 TaxID=1347087 RepID=UPI0004AE3130|nr:DUF5808 domain-containing protein [Paucisalibacillus sp. EB02]
MNMMFLLIILLPVFISTMFIPYWTRRTESFGISIPEEIYYTDRIKKLRSQYVLYSGISAILVTILFLVLGSLNEINTNTFNIYFTVLIFLYLLIHFLIYLRFHKVMKNLKQTEKWGQEKPQQVFIDTEFRKQKLNHSNLWFAVSFLITFATIAITFKFYNRIPEQMPMQYNFDGEVTNTVTKTPRTVLAMPIMQLYLTLLFMLLNTMIAKAKQQISAEKPEESMKQNVIFRRRWSAYLIGTGIGLSLLFTFIQLSFIYSINSDLITIVPLAFTVILTLWAIVLSITTGQGGSRVKISTDTNGEVIDRDHDKHWKLGVIYFNPYDPAIFLEKRFGVGWTVNFARPIAWITFIVIILLIIAIPILMGIY